MQAACAEQEHAHQDPDTWHAAMLAACSALAGRGIGSAVRPQEGAGSETEGGSRSDVRTALKTFSPLSPVRFMEVLFAAVGWRG